MVLYLSLPCVFLSDVGFTPSASDPHNSPPTGSRWQHVKRVSSVGLMYSSLKLKMLGDFRFNSQVDDHFIISVLTCLS